MASITTATIDKKYSVSAAVHMAHLAMEKLNLVSNSTMGPQADAAIGAAIAALQGFVNAGTSTVITTATKITAPVTGSGTTGVTPTIVNGVVTALVLS